MIISSNKIYKKTHLIVSESPAGFEISTGEVLDPKAFIKGQTILITGENPNLLWDLLHNLVGIPYPQLNPTKPPPAEEILPAPLKEILIPVPTPVRILSPLEETFNKMNAKEIVEKVEFEKGVAITNSLKSKKAIIKKALQLYS